MFTEAQRSLYYQAQGFTPAVIHEIEEMRLSSPARRVSQKGLKNIIEDFFSIRNGNTRRKFESYSVEFLFGLELEIFSDCDEYYVQVEPKNIVRNRRTTSMVVDFMILAPGGVRLMECKPHSSLEKLASEKPDEWVCIDGKWTRPPVEAWAAERRLRYEIWSPPHPHGIYQANLMALYGYLCSPALVLDNETCISRLTKALQRGPLTIAESMESIKGLTGLHVIAALATRRLFGTLKSIPLSEVDRFILYGYKEHACESDNQLLALLQRASKQPQVESPVLLASPIDFEHGKKRLQRVERMLVGDEPVTRRYKPLIEKVAQAHSMGQSGHVVCLTKYAKSGRRCSQLTACQEDSLAWAVKKYRKEPLVRTRTQAHDHLVLYCREQGIRAPSATTLNLRIKRKDPGVRAYTEGGYRGFHAEEVISDPGDRTLRSFIPGLLVHVDSTKFDQRCEPEFLSSLGFDCPTLYAAVDSATGRILGRAILFGPSCRNALAVLIRDVFYRQGYLPRYWIADGGSEYIGPWFGNFCSLTGATRIQPPAGASRKNSHAENALGRINAELAHRFLGSTAPDKQGRSVTSRQKSYTTACHNYATVVEHLDKYLFEDMPEVPHGVSRGNGSEKTEQLEDLFGNSGTVKITNMDDFLIATSVPIDRDIQVDRSRGIRYLRRTYASAELMHQIRSSRVLEMRLDCVNPGRMYVRFPEKWVLAVASDHQIAAGRSDLATLFEAMTDYKVRSENSAIRKAKRVERTKRIQQANEDAGATSHLKDLSEPQVNPVNEAEAGKTNSLWSTDEDSQLPFHYEGEEQ